MQVDFYKHALNSKDAESIARVLDTPFLTSGRVGREVESQLCDFFNTQAALLVNSWTNGAVATLLAMDIGVGDEVIVPAMTFIATANCVELVGAKPVFCDVAHDTILLEVYEVLKKVTPRTRAVIPVHLYGQMCDVAGLRSALNAIGRADIRIIEDAAHCFEGMRDNYAPGKHSDAAIFSFYATKNITCGEGGAVITNNLELANKIKMTRLHGMSAAAADRFKNGGYQHWDMECLGIKANLPDILAALLPAQITTIRERLSQREELAKVYTKGFTGSGIHIPSQVLNCIDARHLFCIWVSPSIRDKLLAVLAAANINCTVNYRAVPDTKYYRNRYATLPEQYPIASRWGAGTLSLPFYPTMDSESVNYVIEHVLQGVELLYKKSDELTLGHQL